MTGRTDLRCSCGATPDGIVPSDWLGGEYGWDWHVIAINDKHYAVANRLSGYSLLSLARRDLNYELTLEKTNHSGHIVGVPRLLKASDVIELETGMHFGIVPHGCY